MSYNNQDLIRNSSDYIRYSSLFEDLETISKLMNKHLYENNFHAALRCMKVILLILNELKQYVLK